MRRRTFLGAAGAAALAAPFVRLLGGRSARAGGGDGVARRIIFLYFPDGVAGPSEQGDPSLWHAAGSEHAFTLPEQLAPLEPWRDACLFFRGLSMGPTDSGSHPGGAKKLLTATDGGNGVSIDQHLAATVGADRPFRHVYLGAMANHNGASGDKHISYVSPGVTVTPEDDPAAAFDRLFGTAPPPGGGDPGDPDPRLSVIDTAKADLDDLRARLGGVDQRKLDLHLEALREVEMRIAGLGGGGGGGGTTCDDPYIDVGGLDAETLYDPARFPQVLRAHIDLLVQAMACGATRVGVVQGSHHTSELIMSRFADTPMYDPAFDMRSHQASHYGPAHDPSRREFTAFVAQRTWWSEQLAYLLDQLQARPEDDGTMLDYSIVVFCTEVCDGNTHRHDDMPIVVAGRGGGAIAPGRLIDTGGRRHGDLWVALARALGDGIDRFGDASSGPLALG